MEEDSSMYSGATAPIAVPNGGSNGFDHHDFGSPPCDSLYYVPTGSFIEREMEQLVMNGESKEVARSVQEFPVDLLPGEVIEETDALLTTTVFRTNFRLLVHAHTPPANSETIQCVESIPIPCIDTIDSFPEFHLQLGTKQGRIIRFGCKTDSQACTWYKKLAGMVRTTDDLFTWRVISAIEGTRPQWMVESKPEWILDEVDECRRMGLDPDYFWASDINKDFEICKTYPRSLIMPARVEAERVKTSAGCRVMERIPVVAYHFKEKRTILFRSSQPRSSFFMWRSEFDELSVMRANEYTKSRGGAERGKMVILDCRSYGAALGNRAKGGGYENTDYYDNSIIEWMGLPNIHIVRYAFTTLRTLFSPPVDQATFLTQLQGTQWLNYIQATLMWANKAAEKLTDKGENVLIHCSDGWDRTAQMVTLTKILIDPFYRTVQGMENLIRRDWIAYGHKFADRNGTTGNNTNEKSAVFVQWLDCVHQIMKKYPTEFQFSMEYIVKLAHHVSSGLFTSFSFNSIKDMEEYCTKEGRRALPVWSLLNSSDKYVNMLYEPKEERRLVAPETMASLHLWNELFRSDSVARVERKQKEEKEQEEKKIADEARKANGEGSSQGREQERGLPRSRSSDSIHSTGQETHPNIAAGPATVHHRPPSANDATPNGGSDSPVLHSDFSHHDAVRRSIRGSSGGGEAPTPTSNSPQTETPTANPRSLIDFDGLPVFRDEAQESVRRKLLRESEKCEASRRRQTSELTDIGHVPSEDSFSMDSDASVVDPLEAAQQPGRVTTVAVNQTYCSLCKCTFMFGLRPRKNCRSCGIAVCDSCSPQIFSETIDGSSRRRRACNKCYEKMQPSPVPSPSSSPPHKATPSGGRGGCPDADSDRPSVNGYFGSSQAVKG